MKKILMMMMMISLSLLSALFVTLAQTASFQDKWQEYKQFHEKESRNFLLDFENPFISDRRYLLYITHKGQSLEDRWLGCAAAILYAQLTKRLLFIDNELAKTFQSLEPFNLPISQVALEAKRKRPVLAFGPKPQEKFGWLGEGDDVLEEVQLFGCSAIHNEQRQQFLILSNTQYFVPLLFLNEHYKEELLQLFPANNRNIFYHISKNVILNEQQHIMLSPHSMIPVIFAESKYDSGLDHNAMLCLKNQTDSSLFILSACQQHYRQFAQKQRFKLDKLGKQFKSGKCSDTNRLEDILHASFNSTQSPLMTLESSLGELVGALANRPPIVINQTPCGRPNCCPCRPLKSSDPCYGKASLKTFVSTCMGSFSGNHAYADMFTRPTHIDACKSRVIGIQLINDNDNITGV